MTAVKKVKDVCEDETLQTVEIVPQDWDLTLIDDPRSTYTVEQKLRAVETFARNGNMAKTARETGIPRVTLVGWKNKSPWWPECIAKVQKIQQAELDSVMTTTINEAIEAVNDRIALGDVIRDTKTGELVRVPMKGKELAVAAAVLFDKRSLIRGDATSISGKRADPLAEIEKTMMGWAKKVQNIKQ